MLAVFPQGLEGTLVIPILVGMLVMTAFTEAWGWDFVGVVVPGYLASVSLLAPVVAAVVVAEAVTTWALAVAIDRGLTAARITFPVFGRDRFFLVLAASVVVRMALEAFVFQLLVARLSGHFPQVEARRHELFGIGLVLVPLAANRLWSAGVARGLFQLAVQAALVAAVLRFLLVPFTNFALAGFDPTYDPLALAFLTSPRSQMALLVTAALASLWNRRYGWDFHGILVPALIGLAVLAPVKLLATVVEAIVILLASRGLLALPGLRRLGVEGARRVVLCFCVGVAFKMLSAHLALAQLPGYRPTDLLGFGYLLPSLLAERIWLRHDALLVLLPTLQSALAGFTLTAAAATGLALLAPVAPVTPSFFATLTQTIAAWQPRLQQATDRLGALAVDRGRPAAETADGYRVFADPRVRGLVAWKPGVTRALIAPVDDAALAAVAAIRAGTALALGDLDGARAAARALGLEPVTAPALPPAAPSRRQEGWLAIARQAAAEEVRGRVSDSARVLAGEAALIIDRQRARPDVLAVALAPYGLTVAVAAEGAPVLAGEGWPTVILQPGATAVVGSAFGSELGSPGAAVLACQALAADCVIARDDGGAAGPLAAALAQRRARALVIVRGTSRALGADALVLAAPELPPGEVPPTVKPLVDLLAGRLSWARRAGVGLGGLAAFPPGAGRGGPTTLLWLSPFARRVMSGADQSWWARPDLVALARQRGMAVLHLDGAGWVAAGRGAPSNAALERAETLARTADVAQLGPRAAEARLALAVDEARGLAGFALEQGARRALVLGGDRREERTAVAGARQAEAALRRGTRTLLAAEGGP